MLYSYAAPKIPSLSLPNDAQIQQLYFVHGIKHLSDIPCRGPSTPPHIREWEIGAVALNPRPVESIVQVLWSGYERNLKSGTQCESCGRWYHNSCGNVKFQVAKSGKWNCDRCRPERLRVLEEKLRNAQIQIEQLKRRNKALEEQLLLTENGKDVGKGDSDGKACV